MIRILLESLVAAVAVYLFAIQLESPKRSLPYVAITGGVGWFVYLNSLEIVNKIPATLFAGMVISILSHYFARRLKTPATIYFLSAFFPLVPGEALYRAVFAFINSDYAAAQVKLNEAVVISGAIAMAVFLIDSFFNLKIRLRIIRKSKEKDSTL